MSKAREEAGGPVGRSDRWFAWWQQWDVFLSKNGQGLLDVEMWKNRREQGCRRLCWWGRGAGGLPEDLEEEGDGEGWPEQEQGGKRGRVREGEGRGGVRGGGSD